MRKILMAFFAVAVVCVNSYADEKKHTMYGEYYEYYENEKKYDTFDPLYMLQAESLLSETDVTYSDEVLRFGEQISYALNDRLAIGLNSHYQMGFGRKNSGFAAFDLGGKYRMGLAQNNSAGMVSDVLFGIKFGGSSHVRTPEYANSTLYAGLRFGKQWAGLTLAGTIKSSWIFDDTRGMSYLDFIPEAYFRLSEAWHLGLGFDIVKSTNRRLYSDQEWVNFKLVRQYGRTEYAGLFGYEFENGDFQFGAKINILF